MNVITKLKDSGYKIHVAAAGAGTLIQHELWKTPGASAWLSGASFMYDRQELQDALGFDPDKACSDNTAIHLACLAYMKAYKFNSRVIGIGITASVATVVAHRGDHRVHVCIITPDRCFVKKFILEKKVGHEARAQDNDTCTMIALDMLNVAIDCDNQNDSAEITNDHLLMKLLTKPVFRESGQRTEQLPTNSAIFPGTYNPPHEGHFGIADTVSSLYGHRVVHQITIDSIHKQRLTAQRVLETAKMLKGHDVIFTTGDSLYVQKLERFQLPMIIGVDALKQTLDPKWGINQDVLLDRFCKVGQPIFVNSRKIDDKIITLSDVLAETNLKNPFILSTNRRLFVSIPGLYDYSSTQLRNSSSAHY